MGYEGLDLSGKSAVVIGGTSGIGRAIALGLAKAGADVAATSRRAELVNQLASEIESLGRKSSSTARGSSNGRQPSIFRKTTGTPSLKPI